MKKIIVAVIVFAGVALYASQEKFVYFFKDNRCIDLDQAPEGSVAGISKSFGGTCKRNKVIEKQLAEAGYAGATVMSCLDRGDGYAEIWYLYFKSSEVCERYREAKAPK